MADRVADLKKKLAERLAGGIKAQPKVALDKFIGPVRPATAGGTAFEQKVLEARPKPKQATGTVKDFAVETMTGLSNLSYNLMANVAKTIGDTKRAEVFKAEKERVISKTRERFDIDETSKASAAGRFVGENILYAMPVGRTAQAVKYASQIAKTTLGKQFAKLAVKYGAQEALVNSPWGVLSGLSREAETKGDIAKNIAVDTAMVGAGAGVLGTGLQYATRAVPAAGRYLAKVLNDMLENRVSKPTTAVEHAVQQEVSEVIARDALKLPHDKPLTTEQIAKAKSTVKAKTPQEKLAVDSAEATLVAKAEKQAKLKAEYDKGTPLATDVKTRVKQMVEGVEPDWQTLKQEGKLFVGDELTPEGRIAYIRGIVEKNPIDIREIKRITGESPWKDMQGMTQAEWRKALDISDNVTIVDNSKMIQSPAGKYPTTVFDGKFSDYVKNNPTSLEKDAMKNFLKGKGVMVNTDDTVTLYHGTSKEVAGKIRKEGFIAPAASDTKAYFTTNKEYAMKWGSGKGDVDIVEVKIPVESARYLPSKGVSEFIAEGGLKRDGTIWRPVELPKDDVLKRLSAKKFQPNEAVGTKKAVEVKPTKKAVAIKPTAKKAVAVKPKSDEFQSRVYDRMKAEHPEALEGDLTVSRKNMAKDADDAVELVAKDKQKAYEIAMGKEDSADTTSTAVNIALAEKALAEGNTDLYSRLITNRSLAQTRRGWELNAEKGSVTDNSASRYVREIVSDRLDKLGDDYLGNLKDTFKNKSPKQRAMAKIDSEVADLEVKIKNKKLDVKTALSLLEELTCI